MKRTMCGLGLASAALLGVTGTVTAGDIDPNLQTLMDDADRGEMIPALVYLNSQMNAASITDELDAMGASRRVRHQIVVETLQDIAAVSQVDLKNYLDERMIAGTVAAYRSYWISNVIVVEATAAELEAIAQHDDVDMVFRNYGIELITPTEMGPQEKEIGNVGLGGPENGVVAVRAPEAWGLGYDGAGVVVSIMDTGVDGNHPALASRWRGLDPEYAGHPEWAFFDPWLNQHDFPYDGGSHGTHVMGSVLGGAPGDQVGVAPGAKWIAAAPIDRGGGISGTVEDAIESFQWFVDPDGNPGTIFDVPVTCSNSWGLTTGHGYPPCDETFWSYCDNLEAAGCMVLFAAGNEGFSGLRRPADRATDEYRTLAVAAVNGNNGSFPIASFSSRGPTNCTPNGSSAIKPDIAAPGDGVRSSVPGGGYSTFSGTSMATPHVNGVVALMMQACPDLTIEDAKQIIYDTSLDLGPNGEDNDYGHGMIDAYEAVLMALDQCGPSPARAFDGYYETAVNTPISITLVVTDTDEDPGGPLTVRIKTLPGDATLTDEGNGHVIMPGDLPYDLFNFGDTVTLTPNTDFYGETAFLFAGDDGGNPPDAGEGDPATITTLVKYPAPVITTEMLPDGYLNFDYGAVQVEVDGGQPMLTYTLVNDEYVEDDLGSNMFSNVGTAQGWNADDNSWAYDLPFAFPFYGQDWNQVYVTSNGYLNFGGPSSSWGNSTQGLIDNVRIAPLWDDLRTDQGGDIYIDDTVAGQVTFRWDTVRFGFLTQCNHACTLFDDGRIQFHYGSGNTNLSCTVGVSSGDGTNYTLSQYDAVDPLTNVNTVEIYPPSGLPEGLELSSDGVITGTPLETGSFGPRVRVVDSLGRSDQRQLSLDILEGTPPCPEDLNGDDSVNVDDLLELLAGWGTDGNGSDIAEPNDIIDVNDLLALLAAWGDC